MTRVRLIGTALLVTSAAGIYTLFAHDLSAARADLIGRSTQINTSVGSVEYASVGEGAPILAIHGAGGGFDQAIDLTRPLAERGYRLIAPSRFGYLGSALPANPTTAMQADAYAELLSGLGIGKAVVLGISAGAWSALQFAIRYPNRCRALVLMVPADHLPLNTRNNGGPLVRLIVSSDFIAWAALKFTALKPGAMAGTILGTDPSLVRVAEPREKARVQRILHDILPVSARIGGMQFDIRTAQTAERYAIETISCPVLTISAEDDLFGTAARARWLAGHVPHGRAVVYPSGGHALVGRQPELLREIMATLDQVN